MVGLNVHAEIPKYIVNVYASKTEDSLEIDVNAELLKYLHSVQTARKDLESNSHNMSGFMQTNEDRLELHRPIRVLLVNVESTTLFSIVPTECEEKRQQFMSQIHAWHVDNRQNLKPLFARTIEESKVLGTACAFSLQNMGGRWARGIIVNNESKVNICTVYAVDYSKCAELSKDRLFVLENEEFLAEPIYVHRCKLMNNNDKEAERFSKYAELLKSSAAGQQEINKASFASPSMSHLAIENFELEIECMEKSDASLNSDNSIYCSQYVVNIKEVIKINEIKWFDMLFWFY